MVRRVMLALVTLVVAVLALAAPASAHAQLVDTDPQGGAVLTEAPTHVTLHFAERVEIALGAIRLYDANGREIRLGAASHVSGDDTRVTVDLPRLDAGAYAVAWRVVSADSHPVAGAFTFQIGTGAAAPASGVLQRLLADNGGDSTVGALLAVARFGAFASLAVLVGGLVFVALVWPAGASSRPARRVLWWGLGAAVATTAAGIALQGPYATGRGLGDAFQPGEWSDVLSTQAGKAWAIRGLLLLVGGGALIATLRRARELAWQAAAVVVGIAVGVAFAYSGHGSTGRWPFLATVLTVAHLAAMGVWVGGLVMLLVVALAARRAGTDADDGGAIDSLAAARRFSSVAFGAVVAVVATGVVQGYRQVGGIDELTSTRYGRLLMLKTLAVAAVVALGGASRRVLTTRGALRPAPQPVSVGAAAAPVAERSAAGGPGEARRLLRRIVGGEVVVAVVVLALTSLLVAAPPAIEAKAIPFNTTILQGDRQASITVEPAARGRNTLHVYLFTTRGSLDRATTITVRVTQPDQQFGPLDVPVLDGGPNHVTTDDLQLPFTGQWQLEVLATFGADGSQVVRFATSFTAR